MSEQPGTVSTSAVDSTSRSHLQLQAAPVIGAAPAGAFADEGWHAGRSSGNAIMPFVSGAPARRRHVFVEHTNGLFVPQSVHEHIKIAEEKRQASRIMASGQAVGGAGWGEREDAKAFFASMFHVREFVASAVRLVGAWAFGFCAFQFLFTYSSEDNYSSQNFLPHFSSFYAIQEKMLLFLCLALVIFHPFAVAFELGTRKQTRSSLHRALADNLAQNQSGLAGNADGGSQGAVPVPTMAGGLVTSSGAVGGMSQGAQYATDLDETEVRRREEEQRARLLAVFYGNVQVSPWRHLISLRFLCYIAALATTIAIHSVIEGRDKAKMLLIDDALRTRLHISIIIRTVFFGLGALISFRG